MPWYGKCLQYSFICFFLFSIHLVNSINTKVDQVMNWLNLLGPSIKDVRIKLRKIDSLLPYSCEHTINFVKSEVFWAKKVRTLHYLKNLLVRKISALDKLLSSWLRTSVMDSSLCHWLFLVVFSNYIFLLVHVICR